MISLPTITNKLIDQTGRSVQCGYAKGSEPKFLAPKEALETPYIRFGNSYFIPSLSLDIDTHQDHVEVLNKCIINGIPLPSMILNTKKGLHVHWVLNKPIPTKNFKALFKYQKVITKLVEVFDTDLNAVPKNSGRLFRNPLKHETTQYNHEYMDLDSFILPLELNKPQRLQTKTPKRASKLFSHYKKPDFANISSGERNSALFDYGRYYGYRHSTSENLSELLLQVLHNQNKVFPNPLSNLEVTSMASSITRFIKTKYIGSTSKQSTIDFNRRLAKETYDTKHKNLLARFLELPTLTLEDLRSMSLRKGGEIFGIHKNTYKKHLEDLINDIRDMYVEQGTYLWKTEPTFKEAFSPIMLHAN